MTRRYASYGDSGVEWIGDLPAHWRTVPLRWLASYRTSSVDKKSNGDEIPVRLCNYTDVYYGEQIRADDGEFMTATATAHEVARFGLRRGDVLITKDSEDWRDIGVPALVEVAADDLVCGYHLGIVRPDDEVDPGYLFRALLSDGVNKQMQVSATGVTRYGIPNGAVKGAVLPCPPLDEQRAIAAYLDHETARIDELISKQELLIERLDEYRTALITQVVTKGLPPDAAEAAGLNPTTGFKDSGVEWLGDIPEDWSTVCIRHLCRFQYGGSLTAEERVEGDVPVYGSNGVVGFHDEPNTLAPVIIIGRKGSHGKLNFDNCEVFAIDTTYFVDPACTEADLRWLYYALHTAELDDVSKDSAVPGLSREDAYAKRLPCPPPAQQCAIARYLDLQSERIDALRVKSEMSIERLQEYRSALVSAAVTGKIDVRDAVPVEGGV